MNELNRQLLHATDIPLGPSKAGLLAPRGWCTVVYCPKCRKEHYKRLLTSNGKHLWCAICHYKVKIEDKIGE